MATPSRFSNQPLRYFAMPSRSTARKYAEYYEGRVLDMENHEHKDIVIRATFLQNETPSFNLRVKESRFEGYRWVVEIEGLGNFNSECFSVGDEVLLSIDHVWSSTEEANPIKYHFGSVRELPTAPNEDFFATTVWFYVNWGEDYSSSQQYHSHSNFFLKKLP